jgi:hypothetical protein
MSEYRAPGRVYARADVLWVDSRHVMSDRPLCSARARHVASSARVLSALVVATVSVHRCSVVRIQLVIRIASGVCQLRRATCSYEW